MVTIKPLPHLSVVAHWVSGIRTAGHDGLVGTPRLVAPGNRPLPRGQEKHSMKILTAL